MATWGDIDFDILVDGSTGSIPMVNYPSYGSNRHVPNSTIDITQYTGTGAGYVTYSIYVSSGDYSSLLTAYRVIPRIDDTLTVDASLGTFYIDDLSDAVLMLSADIMCSITFREATV